MFGLELVGENGLVTPGGDWRPLGSGSAVMPPAGAVHWYRKNLGMTEAGTGVDQWNDQIGTDHVVVVPPGTDANRPTKTGTGTLLFNGTTDLLRVTFAAAITVPHTVGFRFKPPASYAVNAVYMDGSVLNSQRLGNTGTSPELQLYMNAGDPPLDATHMVLNAWNSVVTTQDAGGGGNAAIIVANIANRDFGTAPFGSDLAGVTFGASGATTEDWGAVEIAECIVYPSILSDANITALLTYLDTL